MPRNHVLAKASSSLGASSKIYKNHPRALRLRYRCFFFFLKHFLCSSFHPWVPGVNFFDPVRRWPSFKPVRLNRRPTRSVERRTSMSVSESLNQMVEVTISNEKRADVFLKIKSEVPVFCHVENYYSKDELWQKSPLTFFFQRNSHLPGFQALFQEGNDPDAYAAAVKESADAVQGKALFKAFLRVSIPIIWHSIMS